MCDGLKRAVDGAVGDVCLTSHSIDVGAEYGRWTSLQAVFGETGSPRLLGHLLDVHDQFCTACINKLRTVKAEAGAAIVQPETKDGSDTRDADLSRQHNTKLTTVEEETDQCQAIDGNTGHEGTTLEDYGATGHHGLEMECETPEMDHDSEDEGQCHNKPSTSECLLLDHPYSVGSRSTSDQTGRQLQCHHCGIVSRNSSLHIVHLRTHFTRNKFHCDKCCESRANPRDADVDKDRGERGRLLCKQCGKILVNGPPKRTCRRCGIAYPSNSRYPGHTCFPKPVSKRKHKAAGVKKNSTKYTCPEGNEPFLKRVHFKRHLQIHSRENGCKCDICGKVVATKASLIAHTRTHSGDKPFVCTICGKRFSYKRTMDRHIRKHTGNLPFSCTTCGRRFGDKHALILHTRIHTGYRPFSCAKCGKNFSQNQILVSHMKTHDPQFSCTCTTCGKIGLTKQGLAYHTKTHAEEKPFLCATCGKRFVQKRSMIDHARKHTGEKPLYQCIECNKTFLRKQYLIIHSRKHTGERPFPCSNCERAFSSKYRLDVHARSHSGERSYTRTKSN